MLKKSLKNSNEENLGVKGPKKDVGLPMTMPQAAGKNQTSPSCQKFCANFVQFLCPI